MISLEDRIRRLEDRAEIQDLVAGYFRATDDDDLPALGQCFTTDARFVATGFAGGEGRDGVIAFLTASRAAMRQTVHTPNYVHITFADHDHADGTVMAHLEIGVAETTVYAAVRYLDSYRREDGAWRIARREMRAVHLGRWEDVAQSLVNPLNVCWPGGQPAPSDYPRQG